MVFKKKMILNKISPDSECSKRHNLQGCRALCRTAASAIVVVHVVVAVHVKQNLRVVPEHQWPQVQTIFTFMQVPLRYQPRARPQLGLAMLQNLKKIIIKKFINIYKFVSLTKTESWIKIAIPQKVGKILNPASPFLFKFYC